MLRNSDLRLSRSTYQEERSFSMKNDPNLLYGVVGTTQEDRRKFPKRNYDKLQKLCSKIRKEYSYSIISRDSKDPSIVRIFEPALIYDQLAEVTSLYPNVSGLGLHLYGMNKLEGKNMKKKIRDYLFTISYFCIDPFWTILLIEPILKKMNNKRYQTEDWNEIHLMLKLAGNPILLQDWFKERYPDKSSKKLFLERGINFFTNHIRISLIDSYYKIRIPNRKRGHSDKVSSQRIRKPKTKEEYSYERTLENFPEYIDKEGFYMEPGKKLEENLYNIMVKSTERYLEWLKQQPKEVQDRYSQKKEINLEEEDD